MKKALVGLGLALVASVTTGAGELAAGEEKKVSICHLDADKDTYKLLSVASPAVAAHESHGDGAPGAPVPGMDGYQFDESCEAVPSATTTSRDACESVGGTFRPGEPDPQPGHALWGCLLPPDFDDEAFRVIYSWCLTDGGNLNQNPITEEYFCTVPLP